MTPKHFCALAVALFAIATPAAAQRSAGPYSDILGAVEDTATRQTLTFRGSLFGAWDQVSDERISASADDRFLYSGFAGGATGGLAHARRTRRTQWLSSATTALRIYGTGDDAAAATFAGRTGLTTNFNSRVSLVTGGGLTYSPYYEFAPVLDPRFMGGGSFSSGFGVATAGERNIAAFVDVGLNTRFSRRDTLDVSTDARRFKFLDQPDRDMNWYSGGVMFRHLLTRAFGIHAGYRREQAQYESSVAPRFLNDTIDLGVDYGDSLQFSRRMALSFSSSTAAVRWLDETHFRVNGSVALTRAFGRAGSGAVQYGRGTEFTPGFREPLLEDTLGGGYSNQVGRRSSWSAVVAYTRGTIGFDGGSTSRFNSYTGGGRWTTALTRNLGVFGDYLYYQYEVPPGSTFFAFVPKFSRHTVSVGLSVWKPLINDTRSAAPIR